MLDLSNHYLKFQFIVSLGNGKWAECTPLNADNYGIAFHAGCLVIQPDKRSEYKIYDFPEPKLNERYQLSLAHEGFYVFGGKNADDEVLNTLKIFKLGILFV